MLKDYKVSWTQFTDPNHAHGLRHNNMLIKASNKTEAKVNVVKVLGKNFIQVMGVRQFEVEEFPCEFKGGRPK